MKILYCGLKAENYKPNRWYGFGYDHYSGGGYSFEYNNFSLTLKAMPEYEVSEWLMDEIPSIGKKAWNEKLLHMVETEKPDLLFAFMRLDEFDSETLRIIRQKTKTLAWFADDTWRFHNYSRFWAPHFDWAVTTYSKAQRWYRKIGYKNIIRSQWACNDAVYQPRDVAKDIDASFVGQATSERKKIIDRLTRKGINVEARGFGWPKGKISQDEMITLFSRSKINLNLNPPKSLFSKNAFGRLFFRRSINRIVPDFHLASNFRSWLNQRIPQIKARPFEIAGCRAFVISGLADDIDKYFVPDKEMVFYRDVDELAAKIKYWLLRDNERKEIASSAYERVKKEHTYRKRLEEVFSQIFNNNITT